MPFCNVCDKFYWLGSHQCPPLWDVEELDWSEGYPRTFRANDAQEAAEKYAADADSDGDYTVVSGSTIKVRVRQAVLPEDYEDFPWTYFEVYGEAVPEYHAVELSK